MGNYWDYLRLDELLTLQAGFDGEDDVASADELQFIVVHQVYELWFKLILRSMRLARDRLALPSVSEETIPYVVHHLRRVSTILDLAVDHWRVVETLTPQDFMSFRDKLTPSSGFQSFQLREIEILMGLDESERFSYGSVRPIQHIQELGKGSRSGEFAAARVEAARQEQSFLSAMNDWLYRTPIQGSTPDHADDDAVVRAWLDAYLAEANRSAQSVLERLVVALGERVRPDLAARTQGTAEAARAFLFAEDAPEADRNRVLRVRAAALFIESYRDLPLLAWPRLLLDMVVEMEEGLLLFRNRHARAVERMIGRRMGTGGSGGVEYLDRTLSYRVFKDLWALRTVILPKDKLPPLRHPERYGFAV
jgi:tryptophan 2,3-dioxygenase